MKACIAPKLIELTTTTIIIIGLVVILTGCTGSRNTRCDVDGIVRLCK